MNVTDLSSLAALVGGALFFFAGTIGLLRFPDVYTRLHAITKADNLGLGLVVLGLSWQAESWLAVAQLVVIWGLVLAASTTCCHLIAQAAMQGGIQVGRSRDD